MLECRTARRSRPPKGHAGTLGALEAGTRPTARKLRCAVYTRKSSEEELPMKLRFYVIVGEGLRRLRSGVIEETLAVPQLARTRQKFVQVTYEWRGELLFLDASGLYLNFDDEGAAYVSPENLGAAVEVTSLADEIAREWLAESRRYYCR